MKTWQEKRIERLQKRLRGRTRADGTAMPGFRENVAAIRAELSLISVDADGEIKNGG